GISDYENRLRLRVSRSRALPGNALSWRLCLLWSSDCEAEPRGQCVPRRSPGTRKSQTSLPRRASKRNASLSGNVARRIVYAGGAEALAAQHTRIASAARRAVGRGVVATMRQPVIDSERQA